MLEGLGLKYATAARLHTRVVGVVTIWEVIIHVDTKSAHGSC